jgi:hypothetical protein
MCGNRQEEFLIKRPYEMRGESGKGLLRGGNSRPIKAGKLGKVMRYALPIGGEGED